MLENRPWIRCFFEEDLLRPYRWVLSFEHWDRRWYIFGRNSTNRTLFVEKIKIFSSFWTLLQDFLNGLSGHTFFRVYLSIFLLNMIWVFTFLNYIFPTLSIDADWLRFSCLKRTLGETLEDLSWISFLIGECYLSPSSLELSKHSSTFIFGVCGEDLKNDSFSYLASCYLSSSISR